MVARIVRAARQVRPYPSSGLPPGAILWTADFTSLTPGAVATLPGGLLLTRASAATVQTGTSTVVTSGITTDIARAGRRLDADPVGLVLEGARTNYIINNRTRVGWNAGTATTTPAYAAGPDGSVTAVRDQAASGQFSQYYGFAGITIGDKYTTTAWVRQSTAPASYQVQAGTPATATFGTTSADWVRVGFTVTQTGVSSNTIPTDGRGGFVGGTTAGARDAVTDLIQTEIGAYPTEVIVTAGAPATRAGERLYLASAANLVSVGRLGFAVTLRPKAARSSYATTPRLWTIDANNYAEIDPATGKVTTVIGGASYQTASGATWSAYDTVDLWVEGGGGSLNTVAKYRVNGGAASTLGTSGAPQAAITPPSTLDVLCNSTSNHLSAWVTSMTAYRANQRPSWAA